jgi:hypothetical protein
LKDVQDDAVALGLVFGTILGGGLGLVIFDKPFVSIALGVSFGIVFGALFGEDMKRHQDMEDPSDNNDDSDS